MVASDFRWRHHCDYVFLADPLARLSSGRGVAERRACLRRTYSRPTPPRGVVRDFDPVANGQTIFVSARAVASPDNKLHAFSATQIDCDPSRLLFVTDPAVGVAIQTVIEMVNLVKSVVGDDQSSWQYVGMYHVLCTAEFENLHSFTCLPSKHKYWRKNKIKN